MYDDDDDNDDDNGGGDRATRQAVKGSDASICRYWCLALSASVCVSTSVCRSLFVCMSLCH